MSKEWIDELEYLITQATNAAYECGQCDIETSYDEFIKLSNKARKARLDLRDFVKNIIEGGEDGVLHNAKH